MGRQSTQSDCLLIDRLDRYALSMISSSMPAANRGDRIKNKRAMETLDKMLTYISTVVCGVTASFAIGDMLMHNRKKRNEWLADQQAKHRVKIDEARVALNQGTADEDQILLLNQERTKVEAAELQKKQPGMISRIFSSAPKEEPQGGNLGAAARAAASDAASEIKETATVAKEKVKDLGIVKAVEDKVEEHKWQKPQTVGSEAVVGGPLDREAAASVLAVQEKSKSWTNWLLRR